MLVEGRWKLDMKVLGVGFHRWLSVHWRGFLSPPRVIYGCRRQQERGHESSDVKETGTVGWSKRRRRVNAWVDAEAGDDPYCVGGVGGSHQQRGRGGG
jgi:hypothetical protein